MKEKELINNLADEIALRGKAAVLWYYQEGLIRFFTINRHSYEMTTMYGSFVEMHLGEID